MTVTVLYVGRRESSSTTGIRTRPPTTTIRTYPIARNSDRLTSASRGSRASRTTTMAEEVAVTTVSRPTDRMKR